MNSDIVTLTDHELCLKQIVKNASTENVLINGKIVKSGDMTLAHELEEKGYSWLEA